MLADHESLSVPSAAPGPLCSPEKKPQGHQGMGMQWAEGMQPRAPRPHMCFNPRDPDHRQNFSEGDFISLYIFCTFLLKT